MTIFDVALHGTDASGDVHRTVLASVPNRFRVVDSDGEVADVAVVATEAPAWASTATSLARSSRAIVLTSPAVASDAELAAFGAAAADCGTHIVVSQTYADDAAWTTARPELVGTGNGAAVLDAIATVPSTAALDGALLEQVAALRPLLANITALHIVHRTERHYLLAATIEGTAVTLSGVVSPAGSETLTLDLVSPARRWNVKWFANALAQPTQIRSMDASGTSLRPLRFESGHRASWIALHDRLTGRSVPAGRATDIATLARDIAALTAIGALG